MSFNTSSVSSMDTDTIDRLFLELSQFTKAITEKELKLQEENERLKDKILELNKKITEAEHWPGISK